MHLRTAAFCGRCIYLYLLFCVCLMGRVSAQEYLFNLEHFGLGEGLPTRGTYSLAQDQQGYIWVSTQMGIHRFDGHRFQTWSSRQLGLPSRRVSELAIDPKGRVWFAAGNIIDQSLFCAVLDPENDSIYSIESITGKQFKKNDLISFAPLPGGEPGVILVNKQGQVLRFTSHLEQIADFSIPIAKKAGLWPSRDGKFFMVYKDSLYFLPPSGAVRRYPMFFRDDTRVKQIFMVNDTMYSVIGNRQRSWYEKLQGDQWVRTPWKAEHPRPEIRLLAQTQEHKIFCRPYSLFITDRSENILASYPAFLGLPPTILMRVKQVLHDKDGHIWMATQEGVYKLSIRKNPFKVILAQSSIYGILARGSQLWVAGLSDTIMWDRESGHYISKPYTWKPKAICQDSKGTIWFTNWRTNLHRIQEMGAQPEEISLGYRFYPTLPFENPVSKKMWIGSLNGLFRLEMEPDTARLLPVIPPDSSGEIAIRACLSREEGVWVCSSRGLFLVDPKTETVVRKIGRSEGLPNEDLNHLWIDHQGHFWLATVGEGLIHLDRDCQLVRHFTMADGLSNNTLYAVYEDDFQTLWLPSDFGLMAFDKKRGEVIRVYHVEDGIAHEEFNTHSHLRDDKGHFYFGGIGGITIFDPKDLAPRSGEADHPIFINNIKVLASGEEDYEDRTLEYKQAGKLVLSPGDQMLEIGISYLDYEQIKYNQIAYRLKGYQDSWVYPDEMRIILMNLPYGKYEIQVRARGASGKWTNSLLKVPIQILKPLYLRTWFLVMVGLLLGLLIFVVVRLRLRFLRKDRLRLAREVRKRTETIAAQTEELKSLDRAKSRFFANITHEIRTPLSLVIGPAEQLLSEAQTPKTRKRLKSILQNSQSLLRLINQLLDIAKMEQAQMQIAASQDDLVAFTARLIRGFAPTAEQKGVKLTFHCDRESWQVCFDFEKWSRIVYNLVSNAVKFTPEGGEVEISLSGKVEGTNGQGEVYLEVRDTGIGIGQDYLVHIFDRFYQVEEAKETSVGGTGIGLALVKELVELLQGRITVQSELGKGTTFRLEVPLLDQTEISMVSQALTEEEDHWEVGKEQELEQKKRTSQTKLSLLLVEDHAELRSFIRSCIDEDRYEIMEAGDGEEGLQKALKWVPDLIISDVMMPNKDGFELTRTLRANLATSHIPIILLTAKTSQTSRFEGLRRGADAYLTKPFSPEELQLRIDQLLAIRERLQTYYRLPDSIWERGESRSQLPEPLQDEALFMKDLKAFIEANFENPDLKVQMIAEHFGISRAQLYRKLAALTNSGISDLIRSTRCEKALDLISEGKLRISEIAYMVGYASPGHFSRSFKQQYGISPSEVKQDRSENARQEAKPAE